MKILLATDGSEYSKGAAMFLRCLNLSTEDEITVFHALYWIPFLYDRESYYGTLKEIKTDIAPRIVDSVSKILEPVNAKISTAIVDGPPEKCIIDAATGSDMDIIVLGARGISGIEALLIGSVTRKVAVMSSKPVLITKLPVSEGSKGLTILLAIDGSDYSRATGEFLCKIPFPEKTAIKILNVMPAEVLDIPQTYDPRIIERIIEVEDKIRQTRLAESERILDDAKKQLRKKFSDVDVLSGVGHPASEILKTAESINAGLIAVGCRGLRGIKGMMGSVSRNVLNHAKCSVLIGKMCRD